MRCLFLILIFFLSLPVYAQEVSDLVNVPNSTADVVYKAMARQALYDMPPQFNFTDFRSNYSLSSFYDPGGEAARERILNLAYAVQMEEDKAKQEEYLDEYGAFMATHLANIDVVTQAYGLSLGDKRFGDPQFFKWVREGIIDSIMGAGTGENLQYAYDAITPGEEAVVLAQLGVKVLATHERQLNRVYYHMHDIYDPATGREYTIFVDVSRPMIRMKKVKADADRNSFSLRR